MKPVGFVDYRLKNKSMRGKRYEKKKAISN